MGISRGFCLFSSSRCCRCLLLWCLSAVSLLFSRLCFLLFFCFFSGFFVVFFRARVSAGGRGANLYAFSWVPGLIVFRLCFPWVFGLFFLLFFCFFFCFFVVFFRARGSAGGEGGREMLSFPVFPGVHRESRGNHLLPPSIIYSPPQEILGYPLGFGSSCRPGSSKDYYWAPGHASAVVKITIGPVGTCDRKS